ncbi:MAG: endonuclease domain-containing protein [Aestuariivirga sp.]
MRDLRKLNQARTLRKDSTPAEVKLWEQLRNRQLEGFKFLRQATIGPYIVDFLCREKKLVVELDGWTHSTPEELTYDARRTAYLQNQGYRVLRFDNIEALEGMDPLLVLVLEALQK